MNRKIEKAKKKRQLEAQSRELQEKGIKASESLEKAIHSLSELINGQDEYDFTRLEKQLEKIDKSLDLTKHFTNLERSIKQLSPQTHNNKTKIQDFSKLLKAVSDNKPLPVNIDLTKLEKAVVNIEQYISEQSEPSDQGAENYQPVRRVVKVGNRFIFDDNFTNAGGGGGSGGGGTTDGLTDTELRATPVPVSGTVAVTGVSTAANQTTIIGHVDGIEGSVDGIETLIGTTNSTLTTIDGRVDGLETLVTSTNTKLDTANTSLGTLDNAISGNEMQVDVVAPLPAGTNAIGKLSANSGVDIGDVDVTSTVLPAGAATSSVTSVADTTTSTTLKASNSSRKQIIIQNTSSAILYVKYGATATSSDFTVLLNQNDILIEDRYTGIIDGIWATDPGNGAAKITEIT